MHRFWRMHLSPDVAIRNLETIDLEEKSRIAEGIALIAVIDERRDYLAAGYSCMRNYCMGRLHMSEDKAFRRIQVARVALRCPEVFEHLADGRLSVTTAAVLAPHLNPESAGGLLAAAAFQSRHEIVKMLAERPRPLAAAPVMAGGEPDVETSSSSLAPVQVDSYFELSAPPSGDSAPGEPGPAQRQAQVASGRRGRVTASATGEYEVRLAITEAEHDLLRKVQALLGHAVPSGDPALVVVRALKHYLAHLEKQRLGAKPGAAVPAGTGRGIPKPLVRLVWERDGARCRFVGSGGHRCEETRRLEIDHIQPVALGGETSPENLRVLCRAHNQYEAERVLGKEHVQRRREISNRERAKAKAAAKASGERERANLGAQASAKRERARAEAEASREHAKACDAEKQARYDDVYSALRGLGSTAAEARLGAEMAAAMPGATLEACFRRVLPALARPIALRGVRMARCTA